MITTLPAEPVTTTRIPPSRCPLCEGRHALAACDEELLSLRQFLADCPHMVDCWFTESVGPANLMVEAASTDRALLRRMPTSPVRVTLDRVTAQIVLARLNPYWSAPDWSVTFEVSTPAAVVSAAIAAALQSES